MTAAPAPFDLVVVGGGINGVGIARDAAGRGLRTLLAEQGDLGSATSSASTRLIHGGLRYLEHYEFRLVAESLAEREVLLRVAPHVVWPLEFVLPHEPHLRPRWMIRIGLFMYDHLSRRVSLPGSRGVRLTPDRYGAGLRADLTRGFTYSDCAVDDARLVVLNARSAAERGATILPRTRCVAGRRDGALWRMTLEDVATGTRGEVGARALVNVAGPWVRSLLDGALAVPTPGDVRLVKGSHIVVPRIHEREHAYILQNPDGRVIFLIPYEDAFTEIGTTDVPIESMDPPPACTRAEIEYLCAAASRYTLQPVAPDMVVHTWSGVRPLYDDGTDDPSAITRDYRVRARRERPAAALDLRRQAHDVPQARRGRPGEAREVVSGATPMDRARVVTRRRLRRRVLRRAAGRLPQPLSAPRRGVAATPAAPARHVRGGDPR